MQIESLLSYLGWGHNDIGVIKIRKSLMNNKTNFTECPICSKSIETIDGKYERYFPFCCKRCQQIDLGAWATSSYRVPGLAVKNYEDEDDLEE